MSISKVLIRLSPELWYVHVCMYSTNSQIRLTFSLKTLTSVPRTMVDVTTPVPTQMGPFPVAVM